MRIAFLFGAGASKGAGHITPKPPPLGGELYSELTPRFPDSWGTLPNERDALFHAHFKVGMDHLWKHESSDASLLLSEMALYFSEFEPSTDGSDNYSQLLGWLNNRNLISKTAFATLNYECLLDVAANRQDLKIAHNATPGLSRPGHPPLGNVLIWKPHGACNLLPQVEVYRGRFDMSADALNRSAYYKGPLRVLRLVEVRNRYLSRYSLPPAMSLFAPGKFTPVASEYVNSQRQEWGGWARTANLIVIIGAHPLLADDHVWQPIIESKVSVLYVGGTDGGDYGVFRRKLRGKLKVIGHRFDVSLPVLLARLERLNKS